MLEIAQYSKKIQDIKERAERALKGTGVEYSADSRAEKPVNIVFAGQYSAGKSTIIKMLTGRNDIAVGAGITTQQTSSYLWNGIVVTDTPGIHTEQRPDHDEISYKAIAEADILVFTVTSQMFDANIAEHFRKLAIDNDKAGEMILVVNKMMKTAGGNTPEQRKVIRDDIAKVLAPEYTPEQMNLCFLDAKSFLDGVQKSASSPERAQRLFERSGCREFVNTLNKFVSEKGLASRLTTELYIAEDALQKAISQIEEKSDNDDINALEENYLQQRYVLSDARGSLRRSVRGVFQNASCKIREAGLDAAGTVADAESTKELEEKLGEKIEEANLAASDCQLEAQRLLSEGLSEVESDISDVENSAFTMQLKTRLGSGFGELPENIRSLLVNTGDFMKNVGELLSAAAMLPQTGEEITLAAFSSANVAQASTEIGSALKSLKPWKAEKLIKKINRAGVVMSVAAVAIDAAIQIKDDYDAEMRRKELKKLQQSVRSEFNDFASELLDFGNSFIEANLDKAIGGVISNLDDKIEVIREGNSRRNAKSAELREILNDCRALIRQIHKA